MLSRPISKVSKAFFLAQRSILSTSNVQMSILKRVTRLPNFQFARSLASQSNDSSLPLYECEPLSGIKVVDFGNYLAGPLVGRILADAGASVTAVEPPSGPRWKHECNNLLARGKTKIGLDLKSEAGLADAIKLASEADVVIENFSPGVMDRLGLGADRIRELNPRCIYLSLPGFASSDTEYANLKALEGVIMSVVGVYQDMGVNRALMGINPSYSALPLASTYSSVIGCLGIALALVARESSGVGDRLEVPLAAGLCDALIYNSMAMPDLPPRYLTLRELEINRCRAQGIPMSYNYEQIKQLLDPFYHTYICKVIFFYSQSYHASPSCKFHNYKGHDI